MVISNRGLDGLSAGDEQVFVFDGRVSQDPPPARLVRVETHFPALSVGLVCVSFFHKMEISFPRK
jgi:hypothetical protein